MSDERVPPPTTELDGDLDHEVEGGFEFDRATTVRDRGDGATFDVDIDPGWTVGPKPNGGYLLAAIGRAATTAVTAAGTDHRHVLAATSHYLRAPDTGPAEVTVAILRTGRSASQARATLSQDDVPCVDAVFTLGSLPTPDAAPAPWWTGPEPFDVAPIDDCFRIPATSPGGDFTVPIMERSDLRLDPEVLGFAGGTPSGRGDLRGWISFADGRPADPLALLFFLDALPPATFELARTGWVPTLSLTAYVRAWPAPGPLRVRQHVQSVDHDRIDEVCELWDSTGRLVGQATQLAGIRIPEGVEPPPSARR